MKKIITITLNPSLDVTIIADPLNIGYYNYLTTPNRLDASGQGMNISRSLSRLNTPTHALVTLGDDAISQAYKGLINNGELFPKTIIQYAGRTRSDTIILGNYNGKTSETHLVDENATCPPSDTRTLLDTLADVVEEGDYVVCAGVLPHQTGSGIYAQAIEIAHEARARAVLLTKGIALDHALNASPDITIVQQLDVESLFNYPVRTLSDILSATRKLIERGCNEVLIVSNDYQNVVLAHDDNILLAEINNIQLQGSESGVIDALVAGYLAEFNRLESRKQALKFGMAAMLYTAQSIGNKFATRQEVEQHIGRVSVKPGAMAKSN